MGTQNWIPIDTSRPFVSSPNFKSDLKGEKARRGKSEKKVDRLLATSRYKSSSMDADALTAALKSLSAAVAAKQNDVSGIDGRSFED